ncbi:hypothetical protein CCH79_00015539 [Gambusia affinis]|uniref:Ribonuclease P protein subunit p20 n=1 Tax=Gambusia affinis TaxID=33528 RepID=A0A315WW49_GAMAF|nr:hypothetical protein CCH79_00015539 [Gambusia affinis]
MMAATNMTEPRNPGMSSVPQSNPSHTESSSQAVEMDPVEYTLRKRLPRKLPKRRNDVYVNMKTDFRAQLARCQKLLDGGGHREICVHGLGLAINRAINIALQLQASSQGALQLAANTSTVELIDDLEPEDPDEAGEPMTLVSSPFKPLLGRSFPSSFLLIVEDPTHSASSCHCAAGLLLTSLCIQKKKAYFASQEIEVNLKQFCRGGHPPCSLRSHSTGSDFCVSCFLNEMVQDPETGHAHMANCAAGRFRSYLYKFSATFATSSGIFQTHCEIIGRMHRRQRVRHRSNVQKVPDATSSVTQLRPAAQSNHLTHFITGGLWENLFIYLP